MAGINLLKENRRGRFFRYAPLVFWIGVVLFASSAQASMSQTSRFIRPLLEFLFPAAPEEVLIIYHGYIRKFAHFAEYAVLGFFAARAFSSSSIQFLRKNWFIISLFLVLLTASLDEANQSFLASRTGSIWDILLDASGGLAMLLAFLIFTKKFRENNQEKDG